MNIQNILENAEVNQTDTYSFTIDLDTSVPKFDIGGVGRVNTFHPRDDDTLTFSYEIESRGPDGKLVMYELELTNMSSGIHQILDDGEFNLTSKSDVEELRNDISRKMNEFKSILEPSDLYTVRNIYKSLLSKVNSE